ncbi:nitroreductase family deazaflavin-dependent oxidoreductase [Dictyobacter kobayashii]|uniref:Nitroreductase family deazaflavin-dependent oxidoreductase n=1 Tax=Dictyobacter kobayashii TaxID=2014872 RepID=A0A402AB53_9CHLR|nr:nitroreductase family deazaflavin-dependent oxidoreductase [Dictyobacter kobayashii]GCE16350.1 hypothetical protein KDK_01500 [Dictyobacter kobayashii]
MQVDIQNFADEDFCYLTTIGRRSGKPHTIEIWFAAHGTTLYLLSGGRDKADWVKNMRQQPAVQVKLATHTYTGQARILTAGTEDELARQIVFAKYTPRSTDDLTGWSNDSLAVAIDLHNEVQ